MQQAAGSSPVTGKHARSLSGSGSPVTPLTPSTMTTAGSAKSSPSLAPAGGDKTLSGGASAATHAAVTSFVASLPLVNQRVLQLLADLVADVTAPPNQKSNRMTLSNLGVVFAPCIMRSSGDDAAELLSNAKHEVRFASLLFECMANAPSANTYCVTQLDGMY